MYPHNRAASASWAVQLLSAIPSPNILLPLPILTSVTALTCVAMPFTGFSEESSRRTQPSPEPQSEHQPQSEPEPEPELPVSLPYQAGAKFKIHRHDPPRTPPTLQEEVPGPEMRGRSRTLHVLQNPGRDGPKGTYGSGATLEVVQPLRMFPYKALTARCVLHDQGQKPVLVFAKIFDAMYYPSLHPDYRGPYDHAWAADEEYIRTANAHMALNGRPQVAGLVPRFYGSWTVKMPLGRRHGGNKGDGDEEEHDDEKKKKRQPPSEYSARIILEEFIDKPLLRSLDPCRYSHAARENVCALILEAGVLLKLYGVDHNDISPRNIFVSSAARLDRPDLDVVIGDFGLAYTEARTPEEGELPENPASYFFDFRPELGDWRPDGCGEASLFVQWMYRRYKDDPRYQPVGDWVIEDLKKKRLLSGSINSTTSHSKTET